jgi:hypothetical protein
MEKNPPVLPPTTIGINEIIQQIIGTCSNITNPKSLQRVIMFIKALNKKKINLQILKSLSFRGIPDDSKALRPLIWRILLGYLPLDPSKWQSLLE